MTKIIYFKHQPGDGLHYINSNTRNFKGGKQQYGDTSEVCILFNLGIILTRNHTRYSLRELWNLTYPKDIMSIDDIGCIYAAANKQTENFEPESLENIKDVLADVRAIGCPELAEAAVRALAEKQIYV